MDVCPNAIEHFIITAVIFLIRPTLEAVATEQLFKLKTWLSFREGAIQFGFSELFSHVRGCFKAGKKLLSEKKWLVRA